METLTLLDGRAVSIRPARAEDAEALVAYVNQVAGESPFLTFGAGEFDMTVERERAFLASQGEDMCYLLAVADGAIVGTANVARNSPRPRRRHRATMGVSVSKACWGMGIGRALMQAVIIWCRAMGMEQLELGVFSHNERALHLYEKMGFKATGSIPRAVKYPDGSYADEVMMVLPLA